MKKLKRVVRLNSSERFAKIKVGGRCVCVGGGGGEAEKERERREGGRETELSVQERERVKSIFFRYQINEMVK